jgi:hypothetical protein
MQKSHSPAPTSKLDRLGRLAARCAKAFGQAFLDGLTAYGTAMYGVPWPTVSAETVAPPPPETDDAELVAATFQDVDELIAWLNAQSDRVR